MNEKLLIIGKFLAPVDQDFVTIDWRKRGFGCNLFIDPPGQRWMGFKHSTNELVTVVEGLVELSIPGLTAVLEPGDEIYIPKNTVHDVINKSDGISHWLYGYD